MNLQRRKKLNKSLTKIFIEKFNDKTQNKLIENEVNEFLKKENEDLKSLETFISKIAQNHCVFSCFVLK